MIYTNNPHIPQIDRRKHQHSLEYHKGATAPTASHSLGPSSEATSAAEGAADLAAIQMWRWTRVHLNRQQGKRETSHFKPIQGTVLDAFSYF